MTLRTVLVEDERRSRRILQKFLSNYCEDVEIIGEATSIKEAIQEIEIKQPNLIFLDIELKDGKGLDILDHFEKIDFSTIVVTGYDSYGIDAIKRNALDYILKPIVIKDLVAAVEKAKVERRNITLLNDFRSVKNVKKVDGNSLILQTTRDHVKAVNPQNILYIEAQNQYTKWHLRNEPSVLIRKPLVSLIEILPDCFFRVHRSYIVNLNMIRSLEKGRGGFIMVDTEKLPVSDRRKKELLNRLSQRRKNDE